MQSLGDRVGGPSSGDGVSNSGSADWGLQELPQRAEIAHGAISAAILDEAGGAERRETPPARVIGRLVSLNGTQGVISCRLDPEGEDWSVGHLITISHRNARLVGVVCEVATVDARWSETEANFARVDIRTGRGDHRHGSRSVRFFPRRSLVSVPRGGCESDEGGRSPRHLYVSRQARGQNRPIEPKQQHPCGDQHRSNDRATFRRGGGHRRGEDDRRVPADRQRDRSEAKSSRHRSRSTQRVRGAFFRRCDCDRTRTVSSCRSGCFASTSFPKLFSAAVRLSRTNATPCTRSSKPPRPNISLARLQRARPACCAANLQRTAG